MKERPILFSAPMVRAILEGRKTQTRRIVKPEHEVPDAFAWVPEKGNASYARDGWWCARVPGPTDGHWVTGAAHCPYGGPGDRLWVRESFQPLLADGVDWSDADYSTGEGYAINYVATNGVKEFYDCRNDKAFCARITPSIFMPRWASRITLQITDVRVERLHEITESDAEAEGALMGYDGPYSFHQAFNFRGGFMNLWQTIHGADSWKSNPWVWVVNFNRV